MQRAVAAVSGAARSSGAPKLRRQLSKIVVQSSVGRLAGALVQRRRRLGAALGGSLNVALALGARGRRRGGHVHVAQRGQGLQGSHTRGEGGSGCAGSRAGSSSGTAGGPAQAAPARAHPHLGGRLARRRRLPRRRLLLSKAQVVGWSFQGVLRLRTLLLLRRLVGDSQVGLAVLESLHR